MAQLEKARKAFKDTIIEFGETLSPVLLRTTNLSTIAVKFLAEHGKAVVALGGTYAALLVTYKTYRSWQTIINGLHSAGRTTVLALSVAYNRLTGNMTRAAAATKLLKASFSSLGLGLIVTALTAVGTAAVALVRRSREATAAVRSFHTETGKLKLEADSLLKVIETSEPSTERYRAAIMRLQETYGPYISSLIDEKGELTDIAAAREAVNRQIERSVGLRVQQEEIDRITEESLERQANKYERLVSSIQRNGDVSEETARMVASDITEMIKAGKGIEEIRDSVGDIFGFRFDNVRPKIRALRDEYVGMAEDIDNVRKKFASLIPSGTDVTPDAAGGADGMVILQEQQTEKMRKTLEERLAMLEAQEAAEQLMLKRSYAQKRISQSDYETLSEAMTLSYLQRRNALYLEYGEENAEAEEAYLDALIKRMEGANKELERLSREAEEALKMDFNGLEASLDSTFDDLYGQELDAFNSMVAAADRLREKWGQPLPTPVDVEGFRADLTSIEELYQAGLLSFDEYRNMLYNRKLSFAEDVVGTTSSFLNQAADLASSIQDLELSRLEVQKNKELALYGDTADKRAEIEQKYEKKKLDVQIKYADMDMAVKIAQALAAGALASIQAFAQLGPVAGAAMTGLIAATTAMQVATIVAQRNALKSQTLDSSSSSVRTRSVVDGYSEGGYTPRGPDDLRPVGVVHANEWVAPASMLRSYPMLFSGLERLRLGRTERIPALPYASGGYTSAPPDQGAAYNKALEDVAAALRAVNERMSQPIQAYTVLSQLQAKQELQEKHRKAGAR